MENINLEPLKIVFFLITVLFILNPTRIIEGLQ